MFQLNEDNSIYVTRGDVATISVSLVDGEGNPYLFTEGDVLRIKVFEKNNCASVVLVKDFGIVEETDKVELYLDERDTKIGGVISKPVDYWYEIELNPFSDPQTVIGYDEDGAKVFRLFPEGRDLEEHEYTEEEIPFIDKNLDLTSTRPVENQAVARAIIQIRTDISGLDELEARVNNLSTLENGSTTGDAELVDIRVGADGKTYTSAGESVRGQFISIDNEHTTRMTDIETSLGVISKVTHNGYLTVVDGKTVYKGLDDNKCVHTRKMACVEGQVFEYRGAGRNAAVSVIWYNNNTILSTASYESKGEFTSVTTPTGANYVVFASYCLNDETLVFEVNDPLKENSIPNLRAELNKTIKTYSENLYNFANTVEGYPNANGVIVNGNYRTSEYIPVSKGDTITTSVCRTISIFNLNKECYYYDNTNVATPRTITIADDGYIRVSFKDTTYATGMVVKGNELPTNFVAYKNRMNEGVWFSKEQEAYIDGFSLSGNSLYGKKYVACGDSFTEGDFTNSPTNDYVFTDGDYAGCNKVYPYYIGRRNKMTVINEAICGSTLTNGGANPLSADRLYAIPLDADYVTIKIGINDDSSHQNMPIGTIDDTTNRTFYGAWNVVLDYLTTNLPYAKIGIIVTNGTKQNIVDATIASAKKWGIPYINLATDDKLPVMLRTLRTDVCDEMKEKRNKAFSVAWDGGNKHPNAKAHEFESYIIENWMRSI